MRRSSLLMLASFAVAAIVSVSPATAFALAFALGQWLIAGSRIASELQADVEGEFLFEDILTGAAIVCSVLFEGTVGPESQDLIEMVWNLAMTQRLIEELVGEALLCNSEKTCEPNPEIWPIKLPWLTELELDTETGSFYELIFGAGYHVSCKVLGIKVEETCTLPEGASNEVVNLATDVEMSGTVEPLGECNGNAGDEIVFLISGGLGDSPDGALAVSE